VFRKVSQQQRERDRIGAAGQADEHPRTRRNQLVPAKGAANSLMER